MNINDILQNPNEHVRFVAYLDELGRVADPDETDLVRRVLTDPDRTMAQSAVLRHLDRRAAGLYPGPAYEGWAQAMTPATNDRPFERSGRSRQETRADLVDHPVDDLPVLYTRPARDSPRYQRSK